MAEGGPNQHIVPWIVAIAVFMQSLDSTILTTSIPAMARALGEPPLHLHLTLTSYVLSAAAFLPLSGWVADRYGARRVFHAAIVIFVVASALCGLAQTLPEMIAARLLQGFGGAMMIPVGRLILVRSVDKAQLVHAMVLMTVPALLGPIVGPPLGGVITTYISWRAIFWLNVPIGILGYGLVSRYITENLAVPVKPFDLRGFILSGVGLSGTLFGLDGLATGSVAPTLTLSVFTVGIVSLGLYIVHTRRVDNPILDFRLLRIPTLRAAIVGGSLFRIGADGLPFLLPLLFQLGFGYSPVQSGLLTLATGAGATLRTFTARALARFGFRNFLLGDVLLATLMLAGYSLFRPTTPVVVMVLMLAIGGVFRSIGLSSMNTLAFADVTDEEMSHVTGLSFMAQRLSDAVAVAFVTALLKLFSAGASPIPVSAFSYSFVTIAIVGGLIPLMIFFRLKPDAGANLSGHAGRRPAAD